MPAMPRFWKNWTDRYTSNEAYWYIPKGKSVADIETIQKQLALLAPFEGKPWRDSQAGYQAALVKAQLSRASTTDDDQRGVPMARMLAQVFSTLGFAWIDDQEAVTLTLAGEAFLTSKTPADIVAKQARRYQIANPMAGGKATRTIEIHPVPYLLEVMLQTKYLTKTEYVLFCAKARNFGEIDDTVNEIKEWRQAGPKLQNSIIAALNAVKIDGEKGRRSSIYNTVQLNSSYAMAFWKASGFFKEERTEQELTWKLERKRMPQANALVTQAKKEGQFIAFADKKDWMAFYGDPEKAPTKKTALSYYTDTAQLDMVRQVLDEMGGYSEEEKRKYLSMIVSEETVEDILARNMDLIEPGMRLIQRQLITEVGRIDLFAQDKKGTFTIIELKKGKTEDDVFGQLSRYLGWCKKTKARTSNVRGIIIAKNIGPKLWAAADGHTTPVELKEYDLKMSLQDAKRAAHTT